MIQLPETTKDIGELLSTAHTEEKQLSRQCLITIAENIQFLARQGLALRGDDDESDSNFMQLMKLRAIHQTQLLNWLARKTDKYTSPQVQNEILSIMALNIVRDISYSIEKAKYFTIMADEVTDSSNKEQVVICCRSVDDQFMCHEDFVGLYVVESIESDMLVHIIKDTMVRMNLPITGCRANATTEHLIWLVDTEE